MEKGLVSLQKTKCEAYIILIILLLAEGFFWIFTDLIIRLGES